MPLPSRRGHRLRAAALALPHVVQAVGERGAIAASRSVAVTGDAVARVAP